MTWNNKSSQLPCGFAIIPSFPRYGVDGQGRTYSLVTGKLKKSWIDTHGYICVGLQNGKSKTVIRRVHVLMAEALIGERPSGLFVCHADGNKLNNRVENLRYDTPKSNSSDRKRHGTNCVGESHPMRKLSKRDVEYIRKHYKRKSYHSSNVLIIAAKFGISRGQVVGIVRGDFWK